MNSTQSQWVATSQDQVPELEKHFNKKYLMDYFLTAMLIGGVDSLGKNLMIGSWGPENHFYKTTAELAVGDKMALEYNGQWITATKTKVNNVYEFAEDENGKPLYYNENAYSRYKSEFKGGRTGFLTTDVSNVPGEWIWYPMYYDIDTVGGLDNAGVLGYDVDIEIGERTSEGNAVYNTADSQLWTRVRDFLGIRDREGNSELSERWSELAPKFNYDNFVGGENKPNNAVGFLYNKQIATIPAHYFNKDCMIKYIYEGPFKPGTKIGSSDKIAQRPAGSYLYCIHGSRYEQIKRWFRQRIYFLDSLYAKLGSTEASIRLENSYYDPVIDFDVDDYYAEYSKLVADHQPDPENPDQWYYKLGENGELLYCRGSIEQEVRPVEIKFTTYQPAYVGIKWINATKIHYKKVPRNGSIVIKGNTRTDSNQEVFIYGGANIKDLGDLSPYSISEMNISNLTKLTRLILGSADHGGSYKESSLAITSDYLSELDVRSYSGISTINVANCKNLKIINMSGSSVNNINLAENSALEQITYGPNVTAINLRNQLSLRTVTVPSRMGALSSVVIQNCPIIQGSPTSYNATAWNILQASQIAPINTINVQAYGVSSPAAAGFFFLNKYADDKYTNVKISGELRYEGTQIPEKYVEYNKYYPNLRVSYPFITDASNMFAGYNNLNCIKKISAYLKPNEYGEVKTTPVSCWADDTPELQQKWHSEEVLSNPDLVIATEYSEAIDYYRDPNTNVTYRLLKIHDKDDLDTLRAEIKDHLSGFTKFTNVSGMFSGMDILDYLDPDTFNGIDLSEADTTNMFNGCTGLKYFEFPSEDV